jgi:hypothetical protein
VIQAPAMIPVFLVHQSFDEIMEVHRMQYPGTKSG